MFLKPDRTWALVCLVLALQLATAQSFRAVRRGDASLATTSMIPSSSSSSSQPTPIGKRHGSGDGENNGKSTITKAPETTVSATTAAPGATVTSLNNSTTLFDSTIPDGQLPIQPVITPGWGAAGIIMIITGIAHTLIGIKNRWIHSFFSVAYIAALGVSVLIVYVMDVPTSNAVQGGYVAAAIMSGCALGTASVFFKELTEGLGCALGGYCVSMWLLCLVPGGLLQNIASKAIFISCFAVVGFAFYYSRWTRDWALIAMISFSGATVTVLGIDCYSRAGLREFWAYVWNLNENLFPPGADTYPVTKGIRVETAAIVIFSLIGTVSQIKLWRIVKEKRERRAVERAEGQRNLTEEEENVGRQIEETTARERAQWERVYGDGTLTNGTASPYSDMGNAGDRKRLRSSHAGSTSSDSRAEGIEMANMPESSQLRVGLNGLMSAEAAEEGKITVRVAADDMSEVLVEDGEAVLNEKAVADFSTKPQETGNRVLWTKTDGMRASYGTADSRRGSRQPPVSQAPKVVPLPFKVPVEEDLDPEADRSSVATFADEDEAAPGPQPRSRRSRHFLVKRLSRDSTVLFSNLSQRSKHTTGERRLDIDGSSEELVDPSPHDDHRSSVAATVDGESLSGADLHSTMSVDDRRSIEITAELGDATETANSIKSQPVDASKKVHDAKTPNEDSKADVVSTETIAADAHLAMKGSNANEREIPSSASAADAMPVSAEKPKSATSAVSSPASLVKDRLPRSLSKVALSYRTNEWAKHLSNADAPEPDEIQVEPAVQPAKAAEVPRSVDVEDLKKTAEEGTLPPVVKGSDAQNPQPSALRIRSKKEAPANLTIVANASLDTTPTGSPGSPPVGVTPARSSSIGVRRTSSGFAPIVEEHGVAVTGRPIPEETSEQGDVALSPALYQGQVSPRRSVVGAVHYASSQTLLGQREIYLRKKSQANLLATTPEPPVEMQHAAASDAGSLSNYPMYAAALSSDLDDLPLSQRKEMMRQSSMMSLTSGPALQRSSSGIEPPEQTAFNSHQPKRNSSVPTAAAREARLANFRQSVAQGLLRSATPGLPNAGREPSPFASTANLFGGIERQRSMLMEQKEADAQRREMQRREKEWQGQLVDSRMRSGDLLEAHREVIRKMQNSAK